MVSLATIQYIAVWIDKNLHNDIKIKDVAYQSGYSIWYLQRIFRQTTGISLGSYIREQRLLFIAGVLRDTDLSITDICAKYHLGSRSAFTRAFSEFFGVSPGIYRKQVKTVLITPLAETDTQE